jgi:single-stranded DNA-binding protein
MMKISIIGNVGSDPIDKSTETTKIVKFSVGVSVRRRKEFVTQWVEVVVFGSHMDKIVSTVTKGAKVCVTGNFDISQDEKTNKTFWNIIPDSITIIMAPKSAERESSRDWSPTWQSKKKQTDMMDSEEIPF